MLRALTIAGSLLVLAIIIGGGAVLGVFYHYGKDLPDYRQLANYEPPVMTRVHAGDGRLMAEYAREERVFVPIEAIPERLKRAFLAAEDKNFHHHFGLDIPSVLRAAFTNLKNLGSDKRPVGASTITQQVAKNFLLSPEVSLERKIREAILAIRMEHAYTKDHILELYLNEIYLGRQSYGVAAAALNYFDKSLDELTLAESAYLASLPKAPNNYQPVADHQAAVARRNWVLDQMAENGFVGKERVARAEREALEPRERQGKDTVEADYFAEAVRRDLVKRYGEDKLYEGGLSVRTTLDPAMQRIARRELRKGLRAYDRRHGWRGPVAEIDAGAGWARRLEGVARPAALAPWRLAVVLKVTPDRAVIGLPDGRRAAIPLSEMKWARPWMEGQWLGDKVQHPGDVVDAGDVVPVEALPPGEGDGGDGDGGDGDNGDGNVRAAADGTPLYALRQIPDVNGALVAMDPHTGRVLAMMGGYSYDASQFNRATQAKRQPGSAFKPFVYMTALENGFTPSTLILDAPFVIDQGPNKPKWKPHNYAEKFYGPSTMRTGIENSRNLMTVRLAHSVGMDKIAGTAERFGLFDDLKERLAMAIGAGETTLMRLTAGYGMIVNGGRRIEPTLIDRIQNRAGETIYKHDDRPCPDCDADTWHGQRVPRIPDNREQLASPQAAYQVVSFLKGVVERGTGRRVNSIERPIAGKTGTTNNSRDTWFMGFTPDLVAGVYVGFDDPRTLGNHETGSSVAAPIFRDFMKRALKGEPAKPFRIPPGIRLVRVNAETGLPAGPGDTDVILEAFKPGNVPDGERTVVGDRTRFRPEAAVPQAGGLY